MDVGAAGDFGTVGSFGAVGDFRAVGAEVVASGTVTARRTPPEVSGTTPGPAGVTTAAPGTASRGSPRHAHHPKPLRAAPPPARQRSRPCRERLPHHELRLPHHRVAPRRHHWPPGRQTEQASLRPAHFPLDPHQLRPTGTHPWTRCPHHPPQHPSSADQPAAAAPQPCWPSSTTRPPAGVAPPTPRPPEYRKPTPIAPPAGAEALLRAPTDPLAARGTARCTTGPDTPRPALKPEAEPEPELARNGTTGPGCCAPNARPANGSSPAGCPRLGTARTGGAGSAEPAIRALCSASSTARNPVPVNDGFCQVGSRAPNPASATPVPPTAEARWIGGNPGQLARATATPWTPWKPQEP